MLYKLNGVEIDINAQQEILQITYPRGSLLGRSDEWAVLGITEEVSPPDAGTPPEVLVVSP